jgi:hypothetical protein
LFKNPAANPPNPVFAFFFLAVLAALLGSAFGASFNSSLEGITVSEAGAVLHWNK